MQPHLIALSVVFAGLAVIVLVHDRTIRTIGYAAMAVGGLVAVLYAP